MRTRVGLVACSVIGAAVLAACTGGGGGGGGLSLRAGDFGGFVVMAAGAPGAFGQAEFYSGVATGDPNETFEIEFETDDCIVPEVTSTANEVTFTYVDVGTGMTMASGATTIPLAKDTADGIVYSGFLPGTVPQDADWTFSNSGTGTIPAGTIATVHPPAALLYAGSGDLTPGTAEEVTWTGATGANFVGITVYDVNDEVVYECAPKNDGAFTIPADVTTAAGTGGYFDISAFLYETSTFQGKTLVSVSFGI